MTRIPPPPGYTSITRQYNCMGSLESCHPGMKARVEEGLEMRCATHDCWWLSRLPEGETWD